MPAGNARSGFRIRSALSRSRSLLVLSCVLCIPTSVLLAQTASAGSTLHRAEKLAANHHLEQANELLSTLVQKQPRNVEAWEKLGEIQIRQQLYPDATKSFAAVLAIRPGSKTAQSGEVQAAVKNALSLRASGDDNGALAALLDALKRVPKSPRLLTDFGILADEMHIYQNADQALTKAHRLDPSNMKTLYALAHVELDEQEMPLAEKHLRAYLKKRPDDATAHYGMGHLLHMMSQDDAAVVQLDRSIALDPHQIASYYELGVIALERQHDKKAEAEFKRVLTMNPYHGGALTGMGMVEFRSGHYHAAAKYLGEAVLYAPNYVTAHRYYAMTLDHLGEKTRAAQEMAEAQQLTARQGQLRHGYTLKNSQ